jgi:peptidoglycan/LPS O-acetylase OafA/YrhL
MAASETAHLNRISSICGSATRPAYVVHLDALRAIAAAVVVAVHTQMLFFGSHEAQLTSALTGSGSTEEPTSIRPQGLGHHAVIVFFVLSGFLVGSSAWRAISSNRWSWTSYLQQRLTRLWIVLIPALLLGFCFDHVGISLFQHTSSLYNGTVGKGVGDLDFKALLGNATFVQTILVPTYGSNSALWSLANEFWYYMLFPLMLLTFPRRQSIWIRCAYGLPAIGFLIFVGPQIAALFLVWLLGFVVSRLTLKIPPQYRSGAIIASLLQFLAVNVFVRARLTGMVLTDLCLSLSFAIVLYAVIHDRQAVGSRLYGHIAGWLSKFSYTVYLVHLPFLTFTAGLVLSGRHGWNKDLFHLSAVLLIVVAAYFYSWLMYLAFERNTDQVRTWIRRTLQSVGLLFPRRIPPVSQVQPKV